MNQGARDREMQYWASQQLEHDARTLDRDTYRVAVQDEQVALEQGHVSPRMFFAADEHLTDIDPTQSLNRRIWLAKIRQIGDHWLRLGAHQGGFLPEYVLATQAHLERCSTCQDRVITQLIDEFRSLVWMRGLLRTAGI